MDTKAVVGAVLAALGIVLIPTIGYIYSQGQQSATQTQLSSSMQMLGVSIRELSNETSHLREELRGQTVKIENVETGVSSLNMRVDRIDLQVRENTKNVAVLSATNKRGN